MTTEDKIKALFIEILEVNPEDVTTTISFFELGGNSIQALQLVNRINNNFNTEIKLHLLFRNSNIELLTALINEDSSSDESITLKI